MQTNNRIRSGLNIIFLGATISLLVIIGSGMIPTGINVPKNGKPNLVKNIVLVHGAWADGSGWISVFNILKAKGYNVSIVPNPNTSLAADVNATKAVLNQQSGPVILVGHSYGGAIISEAGDDPKVAGLVFVAAFAPDEGESLAKMQEAGPANPESGALPPKDGFIWYDIAKFHKDFCADVPNVQAEFMAHSQIPPGIEAFTTTLTKAAWKTKPSWYIVAKDDRMIPPAVEETMAKRAKSKITFIKSSHAVYISHASEVANIIEAAAMNALK